MGARYVDCFSTSVSVASGEATHTGAGVYDAAGKPARALSHRSLASALQAASADFLNARMLSIRPLLTRYSLLLVLLGDGLELLDALGPVWKSTSVSGARHRAGVASMAWRSTR